MIVIDIEDKAYGRRGFTRRDPEGHLWSFGRVPYPGVARREVPGRVIVNPLDVGRRGQPPGKKPAGGGNVDIRILTSYFKLFILLPGKRTLAILLTGSNIPEDGAGAMSGLSPRIRSIVQRSCDLLALESVWNEPAKISRGFA
ncbi:MAG: hypothetical protein JO114_07955 [Planctomycetaceae bacterium]|nr:hypothetical protein [Planctomycetaceae bacterium]